MQHETISSEDEIPDLCKSLFFTKDHLYRLAWILATLFVIGYGGAVTYAITNSAAVARVESDLNANTKNIEFLTTDVSHKLDILIKQKP